MAKPATADRNWDIPLNANSEFLDGIACIGKLLVTSVENPSSSLNVRVTAGSFKKPDGSIGDFAGISNLTIPASRTTALWLTVDGNISTGDSFPVGSHLRLARVSTDATRVVSIVDARVGFGLSGAATSPGGLANSTESIPPTIFSWDTERQSLGFFGAPLHVQAASIPRLSFPLDGQTTTNSLVAMNSIYSPQDVDSNFAKIAATLNQIVAVLTRLGLVANEG